MGAESICWVCEKNSTLGSICEKCEELRDTRNREYRYLIALREIRSIAESRAARGSLAYVDIISKCDEVL